MDKQYEDILHMTNEEAAKIITKILLSQAALRQNGKSTSKLRVNMALSKAIDALTDGTEKSGPEVFYGLLTRNEMTPNMVRDLIGLPPLIDTTEFAVKQRVFSEDVTSCYPSYKVAQTIDRIQIKNKEKKK